MDVHRRESLRYELFTLALLLCLVMGAALFYFRGVYFDHLIFHHIDIFDSEFTLRSYFWKMIREGLFTPLYPYDSLSHTLLMNPHHKIWYPTNLLLLFSDDSYRMAHWDYLLHYGIAASGWYFYFKALVRSRATAFLSALFITFNGIVLGSHYRVEIASFAWVPWTVWGLLKTFEVGSGRRALYTGLFFSLIFLGGNPELCGVAILLGIFSLLFQVRELEPSLGGRRLQISRGRVLQSFWILTVIPIVVGLILLPLLLRAMQDVPLSARNYGFDLYVSLISSESPQAIFELAGRWLSQFFTNMTTPENTVKARLAWDWYANHSIGIFGTLCLWFGFASLLRDWKGKLLFVICVLLWWFSMGQYNEFAKWSWANLGILQKFRFPGKLFRYFLILSAIPIALGTRFFYLSFKEKWGRKALVGIVLVAFMNSLQILWEQPPPYIAPLSEKLSLPVYTPFQGLESFTKTRIGFCSAFLGRGVSMLLDGRASGLAMASTGDASELPGIYGTECKPERNRMYYDWLGITHLITPHIRNFDRLKLEFSMLAIYNRIAFHRPAKVYGAQNLFEGFDVIQLDHAAGPSYALFSEFWYFADLQEKKEFIPQEPRLFREGIHFKRLLNGYFPVQASIYLDEEGSVRPLSAHLKEDFLAEYGTKTRCDHRNESRTNLTRFPIHLSADLSMKLEGQTECPGVLSIPWAAISGWRATVNGEHRPIVRVGDTTLGILIPKGKWKIEVYYDPKFLGLTLFISIMTFMIVLVLMVMDVGRVLKKQWVQS